MDPRSHPPEVRERATNRYHEVHVGAPSEAAAYKQVAREFSVSTTTLRRWVQLKSAEDEHPLPSLDPMLMANPDRLTRRERESLIMHALGMLGDELELYDSDLNRAMALAASDPDEQLLRQMSAVSRHVQFLQTIQSRMMLLAHSGRISRTAIAQAVKRTPDQVRRALDKAERESLPE
ncbi:MAG: hypothetical protein K0U84_21565 [Actinomycetia bacterium]|nr:hypothetical protein [Actinomycetes bacterium]